MAVEFDEEVNLLAALGLVVQQLDGEFVAPAVDGPSGDLRVRDAARLLQLLPNHARQLLVRQLPRTHTVLHIET